MVIDPKSTVRGTSPGAFLHVLAVAAALLMPATQDAQAQVMIGEFSPMMNFFAPSAEPREAPRPRVYIRSNPYPQHSAIEQRPIASSAAGSFCVRTCDGRFFPVPSVNGASDVKACEAVCPATEMQVYSGSDIENATSERGVAYTKLANAFRFRREIVPTCTCNARDQVGLTKISIEDDPTVRSGDIVAQENGFAVASGDNSTRKRMIFRPLSQAKAKALGLIRVSAR